MPNMTEEAATTERNRNLSKKERERRARVKALEKAKKDAEAARKREEDKAMDEPVLINGEKYGNKWRYKNGE